MAQTGGFSRIFTLQEANELLPILNPWLEQMLAARREVLTLRPELEPMLGKAALNGGQEHTPQLLEAFARLDAAIQAIQSQGVLVKDVNTGLLDFPSVRNGNIVFLCWQYGEPAIEYWHEIDTGFGGRQRL